MYPGKAARLVAKAIQIQDQYITKMRFFQGKKRKYMEKKSKMFFMKSALMLRTAPAFLADR